MSKLTALAKVLKQLNVASKKIIDASLAVMKQIQTTDSELVDDLIETRGLEDTERLDSEGLRANLLEELQQASMGWADDAERIRKELDHFVLEEEDVYTVNADPEVCPFLTEVWNGDSYDKTGIDGLRSLLDDLNVQLKSITPEGLIELVQNEE